MSKMGKQIIEAIDEAMEKGLISLYPELDVTKLRKELGFSQREFSKIYHINLQTLRNWEQGIRTPDSTGQAYLRCIAKDPEAVGKLLNL